jgi:dTDP-4-amino-4,6-dideoxygalactose transaminase
MSTRLSTPTDLAVFGATPALGKRVPLGQHYFPSWARYEAAFRDIFARQYYTNHGPLAQRLEARLAERLNVGHAMAVTNATIALALSAQALGLKGRVIVPALSRVNTAQSLDWSAAAPLFCDVSAETGHLSAAQVEPLLAEGVSGILASHLFGGAADVAGLQQLADRHGIPLYFDAADAFACAIDGKPVGGFGRLEVISLHSSQMLSAAEGAVICTNDDDLAAHIRNIRSNYGMGRPVPVGKTGNGRLSEAQAAVALMNLDDLPAHLEHNARLFEAYRAQLAGIPGLTFVAPSGVSVSNRQNVVCRLDAAQFGLSRDALVRVLAAENIEAGIERGLGVKCLEAAKAGAAFPNTQAWRESIVQLPIGARVDGVTVETIAERLRFVQRHAAEIARKLGA